MDHPSTDRLRTIDAAARQLGIPEDLLRGLIQRGHITGYRPGGGRRLYVNPEEVRLHFRACRVNASRAFSKRWSQ